jgi:hypothetical protein
MKMLTEEKVVKESNALLNQVAPASLMEHTQAIARWERLSGSDEELEAFEYIRRTLDGYGYYTRLQHIDALISLPQSARLSISGLGDVECITHSMGASVEQLQGEVLYCGLGRQEDYQEIDIRGKIALVEGIAMPGKVRAGEEAGAIAQIHISGDYLHEMCISTVWGSPTLETARLLPHTPSVTVRSSTGEAMRALLHEGPLFADLSTTVDTGYRPIPLLTADLPGALEEQRFVLFSGHVDSWYYGAMDNGSANAAQLEVARLLVLSAPHRRGIRVAFWSGHSHGRYAGSAWYVDNHWEDLYDNCVAHVNIDSVGGKGATALSHSYAMQEARPLLRSVIADQTGQPFHGSRVGRAGDHSFMGVGIPAMLMDLSAQPLPEADTPTSRAFALLSGSKASGGLGWWWHTPHDTVDKVDPELLERDTRIYVALLYQLLNLPLLPLDFRLTVTEITELLGDYQAKAEGHFDLTSSIRRTDQLQDAVEKLYQKAPSVEEEPDPACLEIFNQGLLRLSRILTTLNYSESGRFEHDPAYRQSPLPLLRVINKLPGLDPSSDTYQQALTTLARRRNAVNYALREAMAVVSQTTSELSSSCDDSKPDS